MIFIFLKFAICATIILFIGKRVARYGDAIAEKTGLSGLWIGVILVSIATSLPEIFTYAIWLIAIFIIGAYINFNLGHK
ncbi:MAG: hypothetical protein Q8N76_08425 [Candidatus Omnitrophota bacterium]|nr:hypothetical protein [Candidatus Omnitrophota bacterium]